MMQKTFFAEDMRKALRLVRDDMGAEAIILANKKVPGGVEVAAAINTDASSSAQPVKLSAKATKSNAGSKRLIAEASSLSASKPEITNKLAAQRAQKEEQSLKAVSGDKIHAVSNDEQSSSRSVVSAYEYYNASAHSQSASVEEATSESSNDRSAPKNEITAPDSPDELDALADRYESELAEVRAQLQTLKTTLEKHQSQPDPRVIHVKQQAALKLTELGFSPIASESLSEKMTNTESEALGWKNTLEALSKELECDHHAFDTRYGCFSFIGSPGVGKTTLITKLAIDHIQKYGRNDLVLVTLDNQRLGASQQIIHLGQLLQVPVFVGDKAERLISRVEQAGKNKKILIDTAGVTAIDEYWLEQVHLLKKLPPSSKTMLVVSCTQQLAVLNAMVQDYLLLDVSGVVLTKADEATSIAEALSIVVENKLPVCAISHSQKTSLPLLKLSGSAIVDMLLNKSRRCHILNDMPSHAIKRECVLPGSSPPISDEEEKIQHGNLETIVSEESSTCVD